MLVIVDSDCDGYTSSALLLNYLYDLFPSFVLNNVKYYIHEGKEHGLSDVIDYINIKDFDLIILPDAGRQLLPVYTFSCLSQGYIYIK